MPEKVLSLDDPIETEDGDINLDHPLVVLFRQKMLESVAQEQGSTFRCPECKTLLPYGPMHVWQGYNPSDGRNREGRRCTICEIAFDPDTEQVLERG